MPSTLTMYMITFWPDCIKYKGKQGLQCHLNPTDEIVLTHDASPMISVNILIQDSCFLQFLSLQNMV